MAHSAADLECVVNISEGCDEPLLERLADSCAGALLDLHHDPWHHRSVFTLASTAAALEAAVRSLAELALSTIDLRAHEGAHPRLGVVDVVPFVPLVTCSNGLLGDAPLNTAVAARDRYASWACSTLSIPCFLFGPLEGGERRELPTVRREAFGSLVPDCGPSRLPQRTGATAVGARGFLVAYNLWLSGGDSVIARSVARALRGRAVRALAFELGGQLQISCNLIEPLAVGPAEVHDTAAKLLEPTGTSVTRSELVGLLPAAALAAVPPQRRPELGLSEDATIESRLEARGIAPAPRAR